MAKEKGKKKQQKKKQRRETWYRTSTLVDQRKRRDRRPLLAATWQPNQGPERDHEKEEKAASAPNKAATKAAQ